MWPFKKKDKTQEQNMHPTGVAPSATVADGIRWKEILSEGKSLELFDGCRAKCDGTFEDL